MACDQAAILDSNPWLEPQVVTIIQVKNPPKKRGFEVRLFVNADTILDPDPILLNQACV